MNNLVLIDGNSLLFRAYFAMHPMITSKGVHTQGIYAFINMLTKILNDYSPEYIAVAFDMKEKTFRHDVYSEYKAGRLETPQELLDEIPLLHKVLEAMNIAILEMPKYEADDLIGTVSKKASDKGIKTLVISGDKDELQLVDEYTNVLINKKGMSEFDIYDIKAMHERYSLTPNQFIDLKGLMGDKSDNIPGIPGVGEKKGIALLTEYGSVENVIEHADDIPGKLGENVRDNIESAKISKWLATINREAPLEFTWDELKFEQPDIDKLIEIYTELEFSSFIKRLSASTEEAVSPSKEFNENINKIKEVDYQDFLKQVNNGDIVVCDIDTDNNHLGAPNIKSIGLFCSNKKLFTFKEFTALDLEVSLENFVSKNYKIIGYKLKEQLYSIGYYLNQSIATAYFDIEVAEYLIDPNKSKYILEKLVLRYTGEATPNLENVKYKLFYISEIVNSQKSKLDELGLTELFEKCEMPLISTLAEMELSGVRVDENVLISIGSEIDDRILFLEEKIYRESGLNFNINSPKQLGDVLFNKMELPYPKKLSKDSSYSTAADILEKIINEHEIVSDVLEYRKNTKLKSTYIDGLLALIGNDRKIHPHFQQTVTATGRLSCTEPNLQNIPARDEYGKLIRKAFIANDANMFTGSDYSQIELRILASLSGDEGMISAFKEGKDIHKATASRVFNIPEDEVKAIDRSKAKAVNFGVIYGMSGFGLSENLHISRAESQQYIDDYFAKHEKVKLYLDSLIKEGEKNKLVKTYFGRIRQIPEFSSRKYLEIELAKRLAMNTPIQGTAADIIKFAMNSVSNELKNQGLESKLILQIHDELIVEGPETEADKVRCILDSCMKSAANLAVELICDIHSGKTWYELK